MDSFGWYEDTASETHGRDPSFLHMRPNRMLTNAKQECSPFEADCSRLRFVPVGDHRRCRDTRRYYRNSLEATL
jgi:hypothetical protein